MGRGCYLLSPFWALTMARTLARMTALKGSGRLGQAFTMSAKSGEMAWFTVPRSCENAVLGADFSVCSPPLGVWLATLWYRTESQAFVLR